MQCRVFYYNTHSFHACTMYILFFKICQRTLFNLQTVAFNIYIFYINVINFLGKYHSYINKFYFLQHLRMTINPDGVCRVQHLTFPSIFDLLEYFRENHIPLESGGSSDVTLTEYVVANNLNSSQQAVVQNSSERRPLDPPSTREVNFIGVHTCNYSKFVKQNSLKYFLIDIKVPSKL